MTKVPVYSLNGKQKKEIELGKAFSTKVRPDLINRCFLAEQSAKRQAYGTDPMAGKRTSAHYHGRRHYRYSMANREMARIRRIHNQGFLNMTARFIAQAVKGRKAHPPKAAKNWVKLINKKERMLAILSSLAAASEMGLVEKRGHKTGGVKTVPLVVEDKLESLKSTKSLLELLLALGLKDELARAEKKKVRPGKGKTRGRRYRKRKGPLIIVKEGNGVMKAGANIPGLDVSNIKGLSVSLLAPGGNPGRLTVWTESALEEVKNLK